MMRAHSTPWGGKRCARDGASQVVIGMAVSARKMRTGEAKDGLNLNSGLAQREQVSGDPKIYDAPIRLRKAFPNMPSLHAGSVDVTASAALTGPGSVVVQSIANGATSGRIDCLTDSNNDAPHGAKPARAWTSLTHGA
jgi:hypothetical protein